MRRLTALLVVSLAPAAASAQEIPTDSVTTVFTSDSIPEFGAVGGVVADALGYVYIADFRNAVWRLSPDGEVVKYADGLYGASGNAIGPRGYLFQSSFNGNYVARVTRTGHWEVYADEGLSGPVGIAASPAGELFVVNCTAGTVSKIDLNRVVTEFAKSELMACPNGITFDDRGDLFVVSFNNTKVVKITPDGIATEFADILGAGGNGHITFARGAFYVTKFRGNQIFRVNREGVSSVLAGTGAAGEDDGDAATATFTQPNGIGTSGGNLLWVNDLVIRGGTTQPRSLVAMRRIRLVTLADALAQVESAGDAIALNAAYEAYHETRADEDTSADAITVAYAWLTAGRATQATALFQLSANRYASNANAQFHAGEGYRYTSQPALAAGQYRKALSLQPDHPNAAARLAEVTGG